MHFVLVGPSKQIAKNIAAEHGIQHFFLKKFEESKQKDQKDPETGEPLKPNQMEDETPWAQLASLALFKLFNDWQAQGYQVWPLTQFFLFPFCENSFAWRANQ